MLTKICRQCTASFTITESDLRFYDQISPIFKREKQLIPTPTLCPTCRLQRRMAWRNDRTLHHRKSDLTGKQIISMYSADKPYKVYDQDEWWSDSWDATTYGRDFDFTKTFAEQFDELSRDVPHISLYTTNNENSYYTSHTLNLKNCYLISGGGNDEDCLYGRFVINSKDTLEGASLYSCEHCYEGIASENCYNCMFFTYTRNCSDCTMVEDCQSCKNCIGCFGLRNKEYCIFNQQYTKEQFFEWKQKLLPLTWEKIEALRKQFEVLKLSLPHRASHMYTSEDCSGDMIMQSKNCQSCFDISSCENSKFLCFTPKGTNSYDCTFNAPDGVEWCYETGSTVGANMCFATFLVWYGDHIYYSAECHKNSYLFGCVGLRNKKYCIFNKQYTKEEYEELVPKIIEHMKKTGEWGEYFPLEIARFGYNESVAQDFFPLTKDGVIQKGWKWHEDKESSQQYAGPSIEPPKEINRTTDDILQEILACSVTKKPYRITKQELKYYREAGLPIPNKCPDQRHKERLEKRNPRVLWNRVCAKCTTAIQTTYSPDRPEIIYCEKCYLEAIY